MLRLASYDIVFQEIPGEVTLALNLSGCPNGCPGCHSPHLQGEIGEALDDALLGGLLRTYGGAVTAVCFMGGDADPGELERLALFIRKESGGRLKTGWYSGKAELAKGVSPVSFDYIKLGPYVRALGGLDSETTNQRFYRIDGEGEWVNLTHSFRSKS